jgi:recombinational DNA repair protein (RecF pathway)
MLLLRLGLNVLERINMKSQKKLKQLKTAVKILTEPDIQQELNNIYSTQYINETIEGLELFIEELEPHTDTQGL